MAKKRRRYFYSMVKERIKKIYVFRKILWDMTLKQLKAKYAGSRLGIWWAVITPLLLALSISFVFTSVFNIATPNYALFVLSGIIPWLFFATTIGEVANSFLENALILKQGLFPREFIPLSSIFANLLNFLIGLLFLFPLFVFKNVYVLKFLPLLFLAIILHICFIIGLGFLFSLCNVFFRDFSHFLSIILMPWFWITPVFYSLGAVPVSLRPLCYLNPMSYYVILYQEALFHFALPSLTIITGAFLISLLFIVIGYIVFIKKEPLLLKRI